VEEKSEKEVPQREQQQQTKQYNWKKGTCERILNFSKMYRLARSGTSVSPLMGSSSLRLSKTFNALDSQRRNLSDLSDVVGLGGLAFGMYQWYQSKPHVRANNEKLAASLALERRVKNLEDLEYEYKPFVWNTGLQGALEDAVKRLLGSPGIAVCLAPAGAGKSTRAKLAAKLALDMHISGVLYMKFNGKVDPAVSLHDDFMRKLGVSVFDKLKEALGFVKIGKPILIILDDVENIHQHPEFERFMYTLAKDSVDYQKFVVIALCTKLPVAVDLLCLNGVSKSWAVADDDQYQGLASPLVTWSSKGLKLNKEECAFLVKQKVAMQVAGKKINHAVVEEILEVCIPAGDIEFCISVTSGVLTRIDRNESYTEFLKSCKDKANSLELHWKHMSQLNAMAAAVHAEKTKKSSL
jgi:hypothetical protein